jgi:subtilisin family serine protease
MQAVSGDRAGFKTLAPIASSLLLILAITPTFSQGTTPRRFWIAFRDHGASLSDRRLLKDAAALGISDRALWRRAKVLPPDRLVDELDLPVDESYVSTIRSMGARIHSKSRWFNAVSAELPQSQLAAVGALPFVSSIQPVKVYLGKRPPVEPSHGTFPLHRQLSTATLDYGPSFGQLNAVGIVNVHNRGINGSGVIVGMIDDGFNYHRTHPALRNIRVLAEYDFVQRDSNTSRNPGEYFIQGNHGQGTLSVLGGFEDGQLIGAAFGASFVLAKTEIDSVEIKTEEDLYVEALEWMERLGADVVSTSLGYDDFDTEREYNPGDIIYAMKDGKTGTTSKAAGIAARKGVLLVTAMGNEGWWRLDSTFTRTIKDSTGSLVTPADADSIVSVGATYLDGNLAVFSSTGPTADARIKPEIVAPGVSLTAAAGESGYTGSFAGTSAATPIAAGVASLIFSAHPEWTPMQVRERMMSTANPFNDGTQKSQSYPNNFYGWGMVDADEAVTGIGHGDLPNEFVLHNNYPNPFNGATTIIVEAPAAQEIEVAIFTLLGQRVRTLFNGLCSAGENRFVWRDGLDESGSRVASGVYIYRLKTPASLISNKMVYIR